MNTEEETITQLAAALIANFSSHFSLLCGRCWREGRVSRKPGQIWTESSTRVAIATHFFSDGWRYGRTSVCPTCAKDIHQLDSQSTNVA